MSVDPLIEELKRLTESESGRNFLIDFSVVTFVSSVMLARLIDWQSQVNKNEGKLVLCQLQPKVHQVFALTRLTRQFEIVKSEAEGLAAF